MFLRMFLRVVFCWYGLQSSECSKTNWYVHDVVSVSLNILSTDQFAVYHRPLSLENNKQLRLKNDPEPDHPPTPGLIFE